MDIGTVTNYQQAAATQTIDSEQGVVTTSKNELGMDDFFKLLTTQLVSQDPLKPMEDTEFISQMASFSSLSQMESIADNMASVRVQQESIAVMGLIGKEITAAQSDGLMIEGTVDRVEWVDGDLVPYVGDVKVPYKTIVQIREGISEESKLPSDGDEIIDPEVEGL